MKKYFYLLICIIGISFSLLFVGCSNNGNSDNSSQDNPPVQEQTQLATPNPKWQDNLIVWNTIENATSYKVNLNGNEFITTYNYFDLEIDNTPAEYVIKVKSVGNNNNYTDSSYSEELKLESKQISTPYIMNVSGDHDFKVNSGNMEGSIKFTTSSVADIIKLYVNENLYTYNSTNELTITSEMCKPGNNVIKIQACSSNKLYFDSNYFQTQVYKEYTPTNVRVENGKIVYNFPTREYQSKYYDYLGYGNICIPVIEHGYMNSLNSDAAYINVYRTKPLNAYRVNCYLDQELFEYQCSVSLDSDLSLDTTAGTDYNKLEIIVYTYQNQNYTIRLDTQDITKSIEFSVSALFAIEKITFRLYNDNHSEYLNSIITINSNFIN